MVSAPYRGLQPSDGPAESNSSPTVSIKNTKQLSARARTPWPLDTLWSSSSKRASSSRSRSPPSHALGSSYDSSGGLDADQIVDFTDLPLTPPDSGASAFEINAPSDSANQSTRFHPSPVLMSAAAAPPALLRNDLAKSPQKERSKNDIFNSPISWLTPPSRPTPLPPADVQISSPPPSRNSLFFSSFGSSSPIPPSPPPLRSPPTRSLAGASTQAISARVSPSAASADASAAASAHSKTQQKSWRNKGHSRNSSLGRASSEECLEEEARIRATKRVDFRLCPTNDFLLGEGRHCSVYLGSYRPRPEALASNTNDTTTARAWRLCAVKRLHADRQSQLLGLEEAFALRRLGTHPNIIQLIDIRDEVEFTASPRHTPQPLPELQQASRSANNAIGLGLPKPETRAPSAAPASGAGGHTSHSRSTSDMTGRDEIHIERRALAYERQHEAARTGSILPEAESAALSLRQPRSRMTSAELPQLRNVPTPTFLVQGPDDDDLNSTRIREQTDNHQSLARKPASNSMDPPRLLMLLELLPNNLALYARKHGQRIDLQQWFDWAVQMAEAVVFLHSKGCVHADIKKENMLLTEDLNLKLCDFNSAVFPNPSDPPHDGLGLGTPAYCAPELSGATGGPGATSFSYPIDIFSLGAVLYSLATAHEPFSKARSVVEMLHRKRLFFESEENDRASRLAVEAGSKSNSQSASRSGSLRGRHTRTPSLCNNDVGSVGPASPGQLAVLLNRYVQHDSHATHMCRDASNDSLESVASSITTMSGRNPTSLAVARLLEPTDEPRGLLVDPNTASRSGSLLRELRELGGCAEVRRTASTGGRKAMAGGISSLQRPRASNEPSETLGHASDSIASTPSACARASAKPKPVSKVTLLDLASRPDWLRRRSSYGDEIRSIQSSSAYILSGAPISEHTAERHGSTDQGLSTTPTQPGASQPSRLRSMFSPTSAQLGSTSSTEKPCTCFAVHAHSTWSSPEPDTHMHAYDDGYPAIILPGGGRLPDSTRDLLRLMLQADPAARPTAEHVRHRLRTHMQLL